MRAFRELLDRYPENRDSATMIMIASPSRDDVHAYGDLRQELGGVGVTTLALAAAAGVDADCCELSEVHRVLSKPLEHFTARNAAKNEAGFGVEG